MITNHINKRRFAHIASANESVLRPVWFRTLFYGRAADEIGSLDNLHAAKIVWSHESGAMSPDFRLPTLDYICSPMASSLPHDSVTPFGDTGKTKKEQVAEMFDNIAGRYDLINRMLSAGIDISWRKKAIKRLKKDDPKAILDVATGTADMAIMACRLLNPDKVMGIDISAQMLDLGIKKVEKEGLNKIIQLQQGDSETINFPQNSFDAVMVAFGVRNFENLEKGLSEMLRVLKPGGKLLVLEFSRPRIKFFRGLYNIYMSIVAPEMARWFSQNKNAYRYLNQSAKLFPERQDFVSILKGVGYTDTECKPLSAGICCIYCGRKSEE